LFWYSERITTTCIGPVIAPTRTCTAVTVPLAGAYGVGEPENHRHDGLPAPLMNSGGTPWPHVSVAFGALARPDPNGTAAATAGTAATQASVPARTASLLPPVKRIARS